MWVEFFRWPNKTHLAPTHDFVASKIFETKNRIFWRPEKKDVIFGAKWVLFGIWLTKNPTLFLRTLMAPTRQIDCEGYCADRRCLVNWWWWRSICVLAGFGNWKAISIKSDRRFHYYYLCCLQQTDSSHHKYVIIYHWRQMPKCSHQFRILLHWSSFINCKKLMLLATHHWNGYWL